MSATLSIRAGALLSALFLASAGAWAATVNDEFLQDLRSDYDRVAGFINGKLSNSFGFYATVGWPHSPSVLKVTGPRLQAGIAAGADFLDLGDPAAELQLDALEGKEQVDLPSPLPLPYPVWYGRVALVRGLDFGAKGTGYPRVALDVEESKFSTANRGLGFELRYRILEETRYPTVAFSLTWDQMEGDFYLTTPVKDSGQWQDSGGTSYDYAVNGTTVHRTAWKVRSLGFKAVLGKKLGILYPYAGGGFQRNAGSVTSSLAVDIVQHVYFAGTTTDVAGSPSTVAETFEHAGPARPVEAKYLAGFEMGGGFVWNVTGETNGRDYAAGTGFRIQF